MDKIKQYFKNELTTLDVAVYILVGILILMSLSNFYSKISNTSDYPSRSIATKRVDKICMDLPSGITECIEAPAQTYKVLIIPNSNNSDVSTVYLKVD